MTTTNKLRNWALTNVLSSFQSAAAQAALKQCLRGLWPSAFFSQLLDYTHTYIYIYWIAMINWHLHVSAVYLLVFQCISGLCCCVKLFRPICPVENSSLLIKFLLTNKFYAGNQVPVQICFKCVKKTLCYDLYFVWLKNSGSISLVGTPPLLVLGGPVSDG